MQEKEKDKKRKQSDKKMCSFGSITAGKMYPLSECGACGDGSTAFPQKARRTYQRKS